MKVDTHEQFAKFHASNSHIWTLFCQITKDKIAKAQQQRKTKLKLSHHDIIKQIRDDRSVKTTTLRETGRKIDNNHAAYYARYFMKRYPEYGPIFQVRTLKSTQYKNPVSTLFGNYKPRNNHSNKADHY